MNQELDGALPTPEPIRERIGKAHGHINAARRKIDNDTDRGLWSGRQARARMAEVWLWLDEGTQWEPAERYLARAVAEARLAAFERSRKPAIVESEWSELLAAEEAIRVSGFPPVKWTREQGYDKEALEVRLGRTTRYFDALDRMMVQTETAVRERCMELRVGDWVKSDEEPWARVLGFRGLTMRVFSSRAKSARELKSEELAARYWGESPTRDPLMDEANDRFVLRDGEKRVRAYRIAHSAFQRIAPPEHPPITEPLYYWMLRAHRRLRRSNELLAHADWALFRDVAKTMSEAIDAAAKAWWAAFSPDESYVIWDQALDQHVTRLEGSAPAGISSPLGACVSRIDALRTKYLQSYPWTMPSAWRGELEDIVPLIGDAFGQLDALLAPRIDLAPGEWVFSEAGVARIDARQARRLTIDLGVAGLMRVRLFRDFLQRAPPPEDGPRPAPPRWHVRWRWYLMHPHACAGRDVCPCCAMPGVEEPERACRLCGWIHDGGDFDPHRPSARNDRLSLDVARRRFEALGYATCTIGTRDGYAAWHDPRLGRHRQRLVHALDALVDRPESGGRSPVDRVNAVWAEYDAGRGDVVSGPGKGAR